MTRIEFAAVIAYIGVGTGKELPTERMDVYFDLLGDLPIEAFKVAAKKVILEHPWATFPSAAELAKATSETVRGRLSELSASEAWEKAWTAVGNIDLEMPHTLEKLHQLPPSVYEAMKAFGLPAMIYGKEPVTVVRAQFCKIYEQIAARDARAALLPPKLKEEIASTPSRIEEVRSKVGQIGTMPDG